MTKSIGDCFGDHLPGEIEHHFHEFLRIAEVCALQAVSKSCHVRIRAALRERFRWDIRRCDYADAPAHSWLENVANARVNVRSLCLDRAEEAARNAAASGLAGAVELLVTCRTRNGNGEDVDVSVTTDVDGMTLLHLASRFGHVNVAKVLFSALNIDVNAADNKGWTPLHYAALSGGRAHRDVAELLLAAPNIDVNAAEDNGWTPLHVAVTFTRGRALSPMAALLIAARGIDVNAAHRDGHTPLHQVAADNACDVARALIAAPGIDVNAAERDGQTPLHYAATYNACDVARALIAAPGINVDATDHEGRNALYYSWSEEMKTLLRRQLRHPTLA